MSTLPQGEMTAGSQVTVSDVYAYEAGIAEGRRESAERLEAAEAALRFLPWCEASKDGGFCGEPAKFLVRWSDRSLEICDAHQEYAEQTYKGDYKYAQTGLQWTTIASWQAHVAAKAALAHWRKVRP